MNVRRDASDCGIALILVMLVVVSLGLVAGGFALSMKVETRLAHNTSLEPDLEWLGRSGVELARYALAQKLTIVAEPWDSLDQHWAGGPGGTNEALMSISLENNRLGDGSFSIRIVDAERKFNLNTADDAILQNAVALLGIDLAEGANIVDSILDWRDPDDDPRFGGAEDKDYRSGDPPYSCRNGPFDELSELLLVRGITPEMYWGPRAPVRQLQTLRSSRLRRSGPGESSAFPVGLADLFTTVSSSRININTASAEVLQLLPGVDPRTAALIVEKRAEFPFHNPGELINVGLAPQGVGQITRYCDVRSSTFHVEVDAQIGQYRRSYVALLRRNTPRDLPILQFYVK